MHNRYQLCDCILNLSVQWAGQGAPPCPPPWEQQDRPDNRMHTMPRIAAQEIEMCVLKLCNLVGFLSHRDKKNGLQVTIYRF